MEKVENAVLTVNSTRGYGIQSARNYESDRLNKARNKAQSSASIGRMVGGVGGAILGAASPKVVYAGTRFISGKIGTKSKGARTAQNVLFTLNMNVQRNKELVSLGGCCCRLHVGTRCWF